MRIVAALALLLAGCAATVVPEPVRRDHAVHVRYRQGEPMLVEVRLPLTDVQRERLCATLEYVKRCREKNDCVGFEEWW